MSRLILSMVVVQGSLFVSGVLLVRGLGVDLRGELALVSAMVGICSQMGLLGLPAAISYFLSSRGLDARRLVPVLGPRLAIHAVAASLLGGGGLLLLGHLGEPLRYPVTESLFTVIGVLVFMSASICLAALQGERRYTALSILQTLPIVVYALLVLLLSVFGRGSLTTFLLAVVTGWALVPPLTVWLLRSPVGTGDAVLPDGGEIRRFGARSAIASASPTDLLGIDQLLIGITLGHASLGLYVVGWAFETATVLPGNLLATYVGPQVAAAEPRDRAALAWRWTGRLVLAASSLCALLELLLPWLVVFAFGEGAQAAVGPARLLVLGGVFLGLRRFLGVVLQSMGYPTWSTWAEVFSVCVMVISILTLGQLFGLMGACVGMSLAGLSSSLLQVVALARITQAHRRGSASSPRDPRRP